MNRCDGGFRPIVLGTHGHDDPDLPVSAECRHWLDRQSDSLRPLMTVPRSPHSQTADR